MTSDDPISTRISEMGYLTLKALDISNSYYELQDGSILEAGVRLEAVVPDSKVQNGYVVRSSNYSVMYVPSHLRNPSAFVPYNPAELAAGIIEEDVPNRTLKEEFSSYALSNGMILSVKAVLGQIQKTRYFSEQGEPIYSVSINPVYKFKKGT